MEKNIKYFLLACSLILLMGHSILPHNHLGEKHSGCRVAEVKNLSLLEIIKNSLSKDIGDNHLTDYRICSDLKLKPLAYQYFFSVANLNEFSIWLDLFSQKVLLQSSANHSLQYNFFSSGLRAPPSSLL